MPELDSVDPFTVLRAAPGSFAPPAPAEELRRLGRRRTRLQTAGAIVLAVIAVGTGLGVGTLGSSTSQELIPAQPGPSASASPLPAPEPTPTSSPTAMPTKEAPPAGLTAGTHQVRILSEGWDDAGKHLIVDLGRIVVGEPEEPGVDSTRPTWFDTGTAAERQRVNLAAAHELLEFNRTTARQGAGSYGPGEWADLVTEISGRDGPMLATIRVNGSGELTRLTEPYRA